MLLAWRRIFFATLDPQCMPRLQANVTRVSEQCGRPPKWLPKPWLRILKEQATAGSSIVRGLHPPRGGISIIIRNNSVDRVVISTESWVHPVRMRQYTQFFRNLCQRRRVPDCDVNINLHDAPVDGYFGFCREKNRYSQFLLPNHRFTLDDTLPGFETYDDQLANLSADLPFTRKLPRAFVTMRPHASKLPLYREALQSPDDLTAFAHVGPPHFKLAMSERMFQDLRTRRMASEEPLPWHIHQKYQFLVHPRGNTLSDRARLLLPLNAVVLKDVQNERYEELYSGLMRPWHEFVPITAANLTRTVRKLRKDTALCRRLIRLQHHFVHRALRYDRLLDYVAAVLRLMYGTDAESRAGRWLRCMQANGTVERALPLRLWQRFFLPHC